MSIVLKMEKELVNIRFSDIKISDEKGSFQVIGKGNAKRTVLLKKDMVIMKDSGYAIGRNVFLNVNTIRYDFYKKIFRF